MNEKQIAIISKFKHKVGETIACFNFYGLDVHFPPVVSTIVVAALIMHKELNDESKTVS